MRRVNTLLFLAALSVAALVQTAQAQYVWNGSVDTDWTNGGNWDGGVPPTDDTVSALAIFNGTPPANQPAVTGARSVASLAFDYPAGGAGGGWFLGGAGTLTLGTGLNTVQDLSTGGTQTISVANLVVNNTDFTPNSNTFLAVTSVISGIGITKSSGGTLILSGLNTYTGATKIFRATVSVNTLADLGVACALGAESDPNLGKIDMGSSSAPTLTYTGSATSTNRPINIGGTTAPTYTINANGTGALTFTANLYATATGTGTHTLTLGGTNTADNTISGIIPDAVGGPVAVTKTAAGKWVLSGASTYTGQTKTSGGTLQFNTIANVGGGASALGAPTTVANGTIDVGATTTAGTLRYTGGAQSTDRVVNLAGTTGAANIFAEGSGALTFTSAFTATGAGAKTLTLRGTNTDDNTIGGAIVNGAGTTSLTKNDAGKWVLSGASTYTGQTKTSGGTLQFNTIANVGGGASALGAPTTVANGTIDVGATTTAGTLRYTGGAQSTDRVVNLAGTTGAANIFAEGSGALTFTSAFTATGAGAKTLTLRGTNTDDNTIGGAIVNGAGTTSLTKDDAGKWILGGANTYTGATTVTAGRLAVSGASASLGTGNVTVLGTTVGSALEIQSGVNNAIADTATLSLLGGGTAAVADQGYADLGSGINETIASLLLNGVAQAAGTYGSTLSGATFQNNEFFAGTGLITVPALGDYNGDFKVNAADYVTWRKDPDSHPPGGSPDGYVTWRQNFNLAASAGPNLGGPATVPEPNAMLLMMTAIVGTLVPLRRR